MPVDEATLNDFLGQSVTDLGATANAAMVVIGHRLGLYRALADAPPLTAGELAERTATTPRYVTEWLAAQAASGYLTVGEDGRFTLSAEQAFALADPDGPLYLPGAFVLALASLKAEPRISEAFRTGAGLAWHEQDGDVFEGCEQFFAPGYRANLIQSWIPALDGAEARLRRGAKVADVGCGHGASTRIMAEAFPASRFTAAADDLAGNLNPVGRIYYAFSTLLCVPNALAQEPAVVLGNQAGEARLRDLAAEAGFTRFRRAAQTPFNIVLEARP
jgi:hypothetical protein